MAIEPSPVGQVIRPENHTSDTTVLFLCGDPDPSQPSSSDTASRLAASVGATVVTPPYRRTFPAAIEDARAGYRYCRNAGPVMVVGEGMGSAVAAELLLQLRDSGASLPRCAVFLSALLDLTLEAKSLLVNARLDPAFDAAGLRQRVADYLGDGKPTDARLNPLWANLHGLPPIQLHAAGTDALLDDSLAFAVRAARERVPVDLRVWPDQESARAMMIRAASDLLDVWTPTTSGTSSGRPGLTTTTEVPA